MTTDNLLNQLTEGTILEGPHWTETVKVLTAKARGRRIEIQAVGTHTKRLWTKLLKPEEFDDAIKVTSAGASSATSSMFGSSELLEEYTQNCFGHHRRRSAKKQLNSDLTDY